MGSAGMQNEQLSRSTPDLHSNDRDSNVRNQGERRDRGPGVEQPLETTPGRTSGGDQDDEDAHDPAQSEKSRGKSHYSGYPAVRIDHY